MQPVQQAYQALHTHSHTNVPNLADLSDYEQELLTWMAAIWRTQGQGDEIILSDALITSYANYLMQGVKEGFTPYRPERVVVGIDYDTPNVEMLNALTRNTWHFAAAKNHNQLRALTEVLKDESGRLRSWNEFKAAAKEINSTHIDQWLRTEYEQSVAGSQMAGKWVEIEATKAVLPRLRYSTVGDDRVRGSHRLLDGIVRPVDDPFWNNHYPPNGWGCRCMVEQVDQSVAITPDERLPTLDDIPPMMQTNVGKTGQIFGPKHPYFIDAPIEVRETANALREDA